MLWIRTRKLPLVQTTSESRPLCRLHHHHHHLLLLSHRPLSLGHGRPTPPDAKTVPKPLATLLEKTLASVQSGKERFELMSLTIEADMDSKLADLLFYVTEHPNVVSVELQVLSLLKGCTAAMQYLATTRCSRGLPSENKTVAPCRWAVIKLVRTLSSSWSAR